MEEEKPEKLRSTLPKGAQEHILKYKIVLRTKQAPKKKKKRYCKTTAVSLNVSQGYDILENWFIVRRYVMKKNNVDLTLLELLLHLYPKRYFTWQDYFEMPKDFRYNRISYLEKIGMVRVASNAGTKKRSLYSLTDKAQRIVTDTYEFLSGEKKIPDSNNPLNRKDAPAIDKLRLSLIQKINATESPETKKRFFK